jgi:hypothetical protein
MYEFLVVVVGGFWRGDEGQGGDGVPAAHNFQGLQEAPAVAETTPPQPPDCRKDVRKWMYEFSPEAADVRIFGGVGG